MTELARPNALAVGYGQNMEFGVLGPLEVVEGDHRYSLGGPKQRAVLALLIAHAGTPVATGTLIDSLYGDEAGDRAHRSIHTFVSNLRSELGDVIEPRGEGYVFVGPRSSIDACRFEDAVSETVDADDLEHTIERLRSALSLWRGLPYADVEARTTLSAEATRLNELRVAAIEQRIDSELEAGRHTLLIAELEALTVEYPLRENFWGQHMVALYRAGRQAEALRTFDRARSTLAEQTGLNPSANLRELEQRILQQDPALSLEARPTIRRMAVLAVDVADPSTLTALSPLQRDRLIERQTLAVGSAVVRHGGEIFAHRGTAMYAAFAEVQAAAASARDAQRDLAADDALMRMAVSVGDVEARSGGEITGPPLRRAAVLVGAAHGGQVLLAPEAHREIADNGTAGWVIRSLGPHSFAGMSDAITVQQLIVEGVPDSFPPLQMSALPLAVPGINHGLPGYELREEVGSGVFGVVHRAYQPSVGREVSVKVIRPELANHPDFIRRFEVEAQLVARLEHPHIVPLHDYWRDASGAFLVMRWVRGGSVADWLNGGPLDLFEINAILAQIVPALDYAHRNGVVHRDLKPSNILLDLDGNAYLTDFGIATDASQDRPTAASVDMRGIGYFIERCLAGGEVAEQVDDYLARVRSDGFADLTAMLDEWADVSGASSLVEQIGFTPTRNPYKGLNAFGEADAADFHGRDDVIGQLVAALAERRLVAVVGPSGIGKSSVVRAGLIPALRDGALPGSEHWLVADMLPGTQPFEELATALMRVSTTSAAGLDDELRRDGRGLVRAAKRYLPADQTLVLIVDQFEELFTLAEDDVLKSAFLELLGEAVKDERANVWVVLTMRADFFDLPLRFGDFGELLRRSTVPIAAPTEADLRTIITEPAAAVGVQFESGLVERMVTDVKDQPGALPLLEFSLTELFGRREKDLIERAGYEESGGVRGALGRRAELIYEELDPSAREATRQVFLRLVTLPDAERVTRRRLRLAELHRLGFDASDVDGAVDAFRTHRLLLSDRDPITRGPTLEVAHEALFTEWERLAGWIEERRSDLRARGRLLEATDDWEESGRQETLLLSGPRLGQLESWSKSTDLSISDTERELIVDSVAKRESDVAGRRRTRRRVLVGVAVVAVLAVVLASVATLQRRSAQRATLAAEARELASLAANQLGTDPEQSVLLALRAVEMSKEADIDLLDATTALRRAIAEHRIAARFEAGGFVDVNPQGTLLAMRNADEEVVLRDLSSGGIQAATSLPGYEVLDAEFSPSGDQVVVAFLADRTEMWLWDLASGGLQQLEDPGDDAMVWPLVSFSGSGEYFAAGWNGSVYVWSTRSGDLAQRIRSTDVATDEAPAAFVDAVFVPGSTELLITDWDNLMLHRYDAVTGERLADPIPVEIEPWYVAASPDGSVVAIASADDQGAAAYDLGSGSRLWRRTLDRSAGVEWFSDGALVAVGSDGGRIAILDASTGDVVDSLNGGHVGSVWEMAAVPGTRLLATSGTVDSTTLVWDATSGPVAEVSRFDGEAKQLRIVRYAPYPNQVFVSDNADNSARIMDAVTGGVLLELKDAVVGVTGGLETAAVGDGSIVVYLGTDDSAAVLDAVTGEVLLPLPEGMMVRNGSYDGSMALIQPIPWFDGPIGPSQVIDIKSGSVISTIQSGCENVRWFSYDGRWLFDWGSEILSLCDTRTGEPALSIPGMSMRPMPDGETIAVVDTEGTLWLADLTRLLAGESLEDAAAWSAFTTQGLVVIPGLTASADSAYVAVGPRNAEPVKVWEAATGRLVAELDSGLVSGVPELFFHPDDPYITLAGEGGTLLTYTLDADELVEIAEERLTRSLTDAECQTFLDLDVCPEPAS